MIIPALVGVNIISEDWGDSIDDFWIILESDIEPKGKQGSEVFTFYVTSPKTLQKLLETEEIKVGRGLLIMNDFKIKSVEMRINKILLHCNGSTWEEVANRISRYAFWEFENYTDLNQ